MQRLRLRLVKTGGLRVLPARASFVFAEDSERSLLKLSFESKSSSAGSALMMTLLVLTLGAVCAHADSGNIYSEDNEFVTKASPMLRSQSRVQLFAREYEGNWSANFVTRSLMSQNQNSSAWRTEASIGYSVTPRLDFGVSEAYTVPMRFQQDVPADFDDLELNLTAALIDPKLKYPTSIGLSALLDFPTSHGSQLQSEKFGAGLESIVTYSAGKITMIGRGRVLGYVYQNEFGAPATGATLPTNVNNPDNLSAFADDLSLSNSNITGTVNNTSANVSFYQQDALNFVYALTEQLKIRHQNVIETFAKFDGTQMRLIHEQPGLGYKWSKHLSTWYILDAAKSTEVGGSVYQSLRMTHQLVFYFSL